MYFVQPKLMFCVIKQPCYQRIRGEVVMTIMSSILFILLFLVLFWWGHFWTQNDSISFFRHTSIWVRRVYEVVDSLHLKTMCALCLNIGVSCVFVSDSWNSNIQKIKKSRLKKVRVIAGEWADLKDRVSELFLEENVSFKTKNALLQYEHLQQVLFITLEKHVKYCSLEILVFDHIYCMQCFHIKWSVRLSYH